jgi:hypothetical protein
MTDKQKTTKVVVYIPEEDHKRLKSRLALMGQNVSEWVREKIKIFLNS